MNKIILVCGICLLTSVTNGSAEEQPAGRRLLIAYGSYKDRGKYPTINFYEHDGESTGKIVGTIPAVNLRSDSHPSFSHDGNLCAFTSEVENATSRILLWDLPSKQLIDLPIVNDSPNSQQHASLSGDGRVLAFATWNRPGSNNRWDIAAFDVTHKQLLAAPWNAAAADERMPALSADGSLLAYIDTSGEGGSTDIHLWERGSGSPLALPDLNSAARDVEPSLSADGRLIAFVSDRPGGIGARDIHLYDRSLHKLLPLPGLNSVAHEQMPSLSPDGRYLAFVSERRAGVGERDIFIYDRIKSRLLPTPDLNSTREEIDPCIIVLPK